MGHEADNLPPTSAQVRTVWHCTSTPTYVRVPFIPVFPGQWVVKALTRVSQKIDSEHQMSHSFASHENMILLTKH